MILFFINKASVLDSQVYLHDPARQRNSDVELRRNSDVVVIVDESDLWITVKDRHDAFGQIVHPERRARLLDEYKTIVRPTTT